MAHFIPTSMNSDTLRLPRCPSIALSRSLLSSTSISGILSHPIGEVGRRRTGQPPTRPWLWDGRGIQDPAVPIVRLFCCGWRNTPFCSPMIPPPLAAFTPSPLSCPGVGSSGIRVREPTTRRTWTLADAELSSPAGPLKAGRTGAGT